MVLCFSGPKACFCLGSGRTRSGGGVPTRVRAFNLTAFTLEKVRGFDLDLGRFMARALRQVQPR